MAGSIVVAVRKAIVAGLVEAFEVAEPNVSITYGWQGSDDTAAREQIFTSNARSDQSPSSMRNARNFREDNMEFDVVILVLGVGQKPDETDQRAVDLGRVVEEFIADRKSNELGVDGLNFIYTTGTALNYEIAPQKGSISEYVITVRYNARLT